MAAAPHLARVLADQVEHGVLAAIPVDPFAQSFPSQPARDDAQQVHLDGLLNKHHVVLRHGWKQKNGYRSWWAEPDVTDERDVPKLW